MKLRSLLSNWLLPVAVLGCASCQSLPGPTTTWRGKEEGRVEVVIVQAGESLPEKAWLVESQPEAASGLVTFTKWGAGDFRYHERSYFTLEKSWRPDVDYIGIVKGAEFCTVNPEHGGYEDGDSIVITNSYDYCAGLVRD